MWHGAGAQCAYTFGVGTDELKKLSMPTDHDLSHVGNQFHLGALARGALRAYGGLGKSLLDDLPGKGTMPVRARSAAVLGVFVVAALLMAAAAPANAAPTNDAFADASLLAGVPVEAEASNAGATSEPGEPIHGHPGSQQGGHSRLAVRQSGSVAVRLVSGQSGTLAKLVYRAAPGESNYAGIYLDWDPSAGLYTERPEPRSDPVSYWVDEAISPGPGCERRNEGVTCAISPAARATGPLVYLGDGNDALDVGFSRAGTQVFGGPGDDNIRAGGLIRAGSGDDEVEARTWVRSQITGGPGNDTISGSKREDTIDGGPGMDAIFARFALSGHDVVRTRDRDIDTIDCAGGEAFIDGLDIYGPHCAASRRGAARVIPEAVFTYLSEGMAQVWVDCPADGPRVCVGSLGVSAPGVSLGRRFRVRREESEFSETGYLDVLASKRALRRLVGRVKVTVRSRDRAGKLRTAERVFTDVELE